MKFGLLDLIDTKGMSPEDVEKWKKIDEAFSKACESYLKDDIKIEELRKSIADATKSVDDFKKECGESVVDKKTFEKTIEDIEDSLLKIKAATEKTGDGNIAIKSLEQQIEEQLKDFISLDKGAKVVDLKGACKSAVGYKKTINLVFDKKAVSTVTSASVAPSYNNTIDAALSVDPRAETVIRRYANVARIGTRTLTYAEFVPGEGDAKWVPEGGLKPNMDATLSEKSVTAGKVALTVKLTEETLTDLPQLVAEIRTEIINRIGIAEEEGIISGTGTGGEIKGVFTDLPSFSLTGFKVSRFPNMYDALVAAYTQILSSSKMNYRPNLVLMNPIDYAQMQLEKDANGQYLRPFRMGDELVKGLAVETSTAIEQGKFRIGDFNYLNIRDLVQLTITFGWENDDFTKNLVTMIGEKRLMAYVKAQYKTAFVSDSFKTVMEAIAPEASPAA